MSMLTLCSYQWSSWRGEMIEMNQNCRRTFHVDTCFSPFFVEVADSVVVTQLNFRYQNTSNPSWNCFVSTLVSFSPVWSVCRGLHSISQGLFFHICFIIHLLLSQLVNSPFTLYFILFCDALPPSTTIWPQPAFKSELIFFSFRVLSLITVHWVGHMNCSFFSPTWAFFLISPFISYTFSLSSKTQTLAFFC